MSSSWWQDAGQRHEAVMEIGAVARDIVAGIVGIRRTVDAALGSSGEHAIPRGVEVASVVASIEVDASGAARIVRRYRGVRPSGEPLTRLVLARQLPSGCMARELAVTVTRDESGAPWKMEVFGDGANRVTHRLDFAAPWVSGEIDYEVLTCGRYSALHGPGAFAFRVRDPIGELRLEASLPSNVVVLMADGAVREGERYTLTAKRPAIGAVYEIKWRG